MDQEHPRGLTGAEALARQIEVLARLGEDGEAWLRDLEILSGQALPEPQRRLLVHARDMTSGLERHFGARMELRLVRARRDGTELLRQVELVEDGGGATAEIGAIRIHLESFGPEVRAQIVAGRVPLGSILTSAAIPFRCRPRAYFRCRVARGVFLGDASPEVIGPRYGRYNLLRHADGRPLAEAVEVLRL